MKELYITGKIQRWGNSCGIRIPKKLLEMLRLKENDSVVISVYGNSISIKKKEKCEISLEERISNFYGKPLNEIGIIESNEIID